MSITTGNKPSLSKAENSTLPNHDTDKVSSYKSERNTTNHSIAISDSLVTDCDSANESSVCSTPHPPLEKLAAPTKDNISISISKTNSAPAVHCGYNDHHSGDCVCYPTCELCGSYDHDIHGHNKIISLRGIKPRNPQHVTKNYETCGISVHTTTDHNDIERFRKREALQAKKA
nr:hypothetical protein [Tanacetum cinerariifolium]